LATNLHYLSLAIDLGRQDILDNYKRSTIGPFWISIGLAVQIAAIATVFGSLFRFNLFEYLPHLAISLVLWNLIVGVANDAAGAFQQSERIMRQVWIPSYLPIARSFSKQLIVLAHNLVVVLLVIAIMGVHPGAGVWLAIPAFLVLGVALFSISVVLALIGAKFRDLGPIVASALMVGFYATPVIWMPSALPENLRTLIVTWNPLFHLMEIFRGPLLGNPPLTGAWLGALLTMGVASALAYATYSHFAYRVVYWL
jgi:ABC-type polysaccharide/polyol phosphate export permease